jgi:hypothetical protein
MIHFTTQRIKSQRAKKKEEKNIAKKNFQKTLDKKKSLWYHTLREKEEEFSALTYAQR